MKLLLAALLAMAALPCAFAQSGLTPAKDTLAQPGAGMMEGDTLVYPRDAAYPAGLAARGVQGRVVVRVKVGADGKALDASVAESSRSRELDKAALALARSYPYAPAKPGVAPGEVLVPIRFRKDSVTDLPNKTCADFNIDKAYFSATFPELKVSDMEVVKMASGTLLFTLPGPQQMPYARNSSAVAAAAIAACATQPGDKLFTLMQREAAKLPRK
jgi:TonB family protein